MERVKVKYCYSEDDLNEFLATLYTDKATYPQFDSVYYVSSDRINSGVIAAVQYYIDI